MLFNRCLDKIITLYDLGLLSHHVKVDKYDYHAINSDCRHLSYPVLILIIFNILCKNNISQNSMLNKGVIIRVRVN